MRTTFINRLLDLAKNDSRIILAVGDLGFSVVEKFQDELPEQFFNAGIAEQNLVGLAAGLASEGNRVFVYSIANFPTFRAAEQIRNDVDYHNLDVTIVSVGGGLSYGNLGYSHHAVQDYGLMRLFPNMKIYAPGDPLETELALDHIVASKGPSYLRLGKTGEKTITSSRDTLVPGEWRIVKGLASAKRAILSTGASLPYAEELYDSFPEGSSVLFSMPLWGMSMKATQSFQINKFNEVHTVEDHLVDAGFGSWLIESASSAPGLSGKITIHALDAKILGEVGTQDDLNRRGGLSFA